MGNATMRRGQESTKKIIAYSVLALHSHISVNAFEDMEIVSQ